MPRPAVGNPDSDPIPTRKLHSRRRIRNPEIRFPLSRQRKAVAAAAAAPTARASTPQLSWKFVESGSDPHRASARKLAAGLWHSELLDVEAGRTKPNIGHQQHPQVPQRLKHGLKPQNDNLHKLQSSVIYPDPSMERATKWDSKFLKQSIEGVHQSFDHLRLLAGQQVTQASSLESKLKAELDWARARIAKLESKRHSAKKKIEYILKKHADEKASWRIRDHQKIQAVMDGMKDDLSFERKNRRRTEVLNAKLLEELTEAKKSAKRCLHEYEKEKKARELLEDVCDQLAKEVGEDRTEVEESKRESIRVREELEEERKMLQMAEVWREERVQMKLIDAKLALEKQCAQLRNLQIELESFLRSASTNNLDAEAIKEAELLIEAVAVSVKIQEIKEFNYNPPPASEDIYSIFEELQQQAEPKEREVEPCNDSESPASDSSKALTVSPATDIFLGKPTNGSADDDSEWETLSHGDIDTSNSLEGSDINNCEIDEDFKRSASSISKLWPTYTDNCKNIKKIPAEFPKQRVSSVGLNEECFSPPNLEHWSSPESAKNPHVTRGMKGCIEWPRGIHKQSLKTKLLEARLESNKVQIRHVLKQKI